MMLQSLPKSRLFPQRTATMSIRRYATGPTPNPKWKYVPQSGTYPQGFSVGGIHCGVKKDGKSLDLALVTSELPCSAAAVFTKNVFKAAPVVMSREMLDKRKGSGIRGLVANSGCANAVTGKGGMEDAVAMGREVDKLVGEEESSIVVMSTGVIGQRYYCTLAIVGLKKGKADFIGEDFLFRKFLMESREPIRLRVLPTRIGSTPQRLSVPQIPSPSSAPRASPSLALSLSITLLVWPRALE